MPKISIIVPVYKVEKYLHRCLDSIVNQTFTDWECILVDDGSPDNSGKICDEYAEKDKRFRVFHQKNAGVSAARNKGLDEVKGEWVGFVDSDDWIETNMYEYLYSDAIKTKVDVVICGFVGQHKKRIKKLYNTEEAQIFLFSSKGFGGFSVLRLIAAKKIQNVRYDTEMTYLEDTKFFYEVFKNCKTIYWDNEPLYNYFQREDSVTHKYGLTPHAKTGLNFLENSYQNENIITVKNAILSKIIVYCASLALMYIRHNDVSNDSFLYLKNKVKSNLSQAICSKDMTLRAKIKVLVISYYNFPILKFFFRYL